MAAGPAGCGQARVYGRTQGLSIRGALSQTIFIAKGGNYWGNHIMDHKLPDVCAMLVNSVVNNCMMKVVRAGHIHIETRLIAEAVFK